MLLVIYNEEDRVEDLEEVIKDSLKIVLHAPGVMYKSFQCIE